MARTYVRSYKKKDGTRVRSYTRNNSGSGAGVVVAVVVAGVVASGVTFQALAGGGASTGPQDLRLALSSLRLGAATVDFGSRTPKVKHQSGYVIVEYRLDVKASGSSVRWDGERQRLELEGGETVAGDASTVRVKAGAHRQVTLRFNLDENADPVELHLRISGKKGSVEIQGRVAATTSSHG